jgi:hypothetical protein
MGKLGCGEDALLNQSETQTRLCLQRRTRCSSATLLKQSRRPARGA